jgi:peroxiredoxin Q/BCP
MKRLLTGLVALSCLAAAPAFAALTPGDKAPDFSAQASLGGKVSTFSLKSALKKGPVVLYFYPAASTPGCTREAPEFADAMDDFHKLHATVIGVSRDDIDKLNKFSVSECRSKFPVAADGDGHITASYDATLKFGPKEVANRTSYVIGKDGTVAYEYTSLDPSKHVSNTMDAVKGLEHH